LALVAILRRKVASRLIFDCGLLQISSIQENAGSRNQKAGSLAAVSCQGFTENLQRFGISQIHTVDVSNLVKNKGANSIVNSGI
jgi:hypothetical protein